MVLEGRAANVGGTRGSLFHRSATGNTVITCQRGEQGGYLLGLSRKDTGTGQTRRVHITLSEVEALGIRQVLQSSLFFLAFHQHLLGVWAGPSS